MPYFQKRPVIIEAVQLLPRGTDPVDRAHRMMLIDDFVKGQKVRWDGDALSIETLEGTMRADPGDWIIKGVNGEFYPCKPEIFEATYDQVLALDASKDLAGDDDLDDYERNNPDVARLVRNR